jgi:hypothetical protein
MSEPSCLSTDIQSKEKFFSHYDMVIEEMVKQLDKYLRDNLKDLISYDKNYGNTISINIQCCTSLVSDLLSKTA